MNTTEFETDGSGAIWRLAPHDILQGSIVDIQRYFVDETSSRTSRATAAVGIRFRLPKGVGSGHWDFVRASPNLDVMICTAEYHDDFVLNVPGDHMVKVRILLSGELDSGEAHQKLFGTGAFVEAYPGDAPSSYTLKGGELIRFIVLCCTPAFFTEEMGLESQSLPFPLNHVFGDSTASPEGGVAPLSPDVMGAANDILRSGTRFSPMLQKPYIAAKAREIACSMISILSKHPAEAASGRRPSLRDVNRVEEARDILQDEYQRPPPIPQLARRVGVNQTKLKSLFKAMFGMTTHEFTQKCRMDRALDLLATSDLGVAEIAFLVGYEYPASFTHAFRQYFGHSPRQMRQAGLLSTNEKRPA